MLQKTRMYSPIRQEMLMLESQTSSGAVARGKCNKTVK